MSAVYPVFNVGLKLYTKTSQSTSGLWGGNLSQNFSFVTPQHNTSPDHLSRIEWKVWYMCYNGASLNHKFKNYISIWRNENNTDTGLYPYVNANQAIPADLSATIYFAQNVYPLDYDNHGYVIFDPGPSMVQYDSAVFGYPRMMGSSVQYLRQCWRDGSVYNINNAYSWNSYMPVPNPSPADPEQVMYRFYGIDNIPANYVAARTAYLEKFYNDINPFLGPQYSVPVNIKNGNFNYHISLMNSLAEPENGLSCYSSDILSDPTGSLGLHRYQILNFKPFGNTATQGSSYYTSFNFPFQPDANSRGSYPPWIGTLLTDGLDKVVCWNIIKFISYNGTTQQAGFISNSISAGNVIASYDSHIPTNLFTYGGLTIYNSSTQYGPGGAWPAKDWFGFKISPSVFHMSPSWDIISHSSKVKWNALNNGAVAIARMGYGNPTDDKFNAC